MQDYFFFKNESIYERINFDAILYIEARLNYMRVVTTDKFYTLFLSMHELESALPDSLFCRVSRSYIIALNQVHAFDDSQIVLQNGQIIPLEPKYRDHFAGSLPILLSAHRAPVLYHRQEQRKLKRSTQKNVN